MTRVRGKRTTQHDYKVILASSPGHRTHIPLITGSQILHKQLPTGDQSDSCWPPWKDHKEEEGWSVWEGKGFGVVW